MCMVPSALLVLLKAFRRPPVITPKFIRMASCRNVAHLREDDLMTFFFFFVFAFGCVVGVHISWNVVVSGWELKASGTREKSIVSERNLGINLFFLLFHFCLEMRLNCHREGLGDQLQFCCLSQHINYIGRRRKMEKGFLWLSI